MSGYCLPWAAIDWETPHTPRSTDHDDIYWSRDQGLAEKQHVFVEGNDLAKRFSDLGRSHFTIAEIGFGFGLNFLLTVETWRNSAPAAAVLNFLSFERTPVSPTDLSTCYARLGIDSAAASALLEKMPLPVPGWHIIPIADDINLILALGDARHLLADMDATIDCWFLDGFSPRVNADAWDDPVLDALASHSRRGATAATYSVAGAVRRGVESAGFAVERAPGYGSKAEMLRARYTGEWSPDHFDVDSVGIIGSGLAGLSLARSLRRRGIECTLFDKGDSPLAGASGAPALAVYPQLSAMPELPGQLSLTAFSFARNFYQTYHECGRCQLAESPEAVERFRQVAGHLPADFACFLDAHEITQRLSVDCRYPGLYFSRAGYVIGAAEFREPAAFQGGQTVTGCTGNVITTEAGEYEFDAVVIACGHAEFDQTTPLRRTPVRGQNMTGELKTDVDAIVGGPVSIVPIGERRVVVGGTYAQQDTDVQLRNDETLSLAARAERHLELEIEPESAWAGIRSSTRDRQPIVGPLPDWQRLEQWCHGGGSAFNGWTPGLFAMIGFGSHGATTAPLLAEALARQLSGEAGCLGLAGAARLNPARFALRDAGRRREVSSLRRVRQDRRRAR